MSISGMLFGADSPTAIANGETVVGRSAIFGSVISAPIRVVLEAVGLMSAIFILPLFLPLFFGSHPARILRADEFP